jgi:hypothetical protein
MIFPEGTPQLLYLPAMAIDKAGIIFLNVTHILGALLI